MDPTMVDDLSEKYRNASERLRALGEDAVRRVQDAMSATPGWLAAAKAAAAHAVLATTACEADRFVSEILRAHIDSGERNPEAAVQRLREEFLSGLAPPGSGFFQGSTPEMASLTPVALRHAAEFESWRDGLIADLPDRFRRMLEARQHAAATELHMPHRGVRDNRLLLGFLVLTLAMSLGGLSWLDLARRALAVF
jgi:hypothetical protein